MSVHTVHENPLGSRIKKISFLVGDRGSVSSRADDEEGAGRGTEARKQKAPRGGGRRHPLRSVWGQGLGNALQGPCL